MDQSKKPKFSSESDFADDSSASSSSGRNLRPEMVMEVKKEPVSSQKIQKADQEKLRSDRLNEQFLELGNALDRNRPKIDEISTLTDTIQILKDLMIQVDKLKTKHSTLSQESRELIQEKIELKDEISSLKSDIQILNSEYQHRIRTMVPWIPHHILLESITQSPISIPQLLPFSVHGSQNPTVVPSLCSTFIPYSVSVNPSSSPGNSNKQDSKSKSLDQINDHKDDAGLELELKIQVSSSARQIKVTSMKDISGKEKIESSTTTAISSSQTVQGIVNSDDYPGET